MPAKLFFFNFSKKNDKREIHHEAVEIAKKLVKKHQERNYLSVKLAN